VRVRVTREREDDEVRKTHTHTRRHPLAYRLDEKNL
jgi:hypothetical protein